MSGETAAIGFGFKKAGVLPFHRKRLIPLESMLVELAATKAQLLMFMIGCFVSGGLALALGAIYGSFFNLYSAPGFIIGAFFAFKYMTFDKNRERQEEHRRKRNRH
jgi:hypothetical protein